MSPTGFRRLVLELGHGAADPATILEAATFARTLGLELLALFIEDESLAHIAGLPFAREISPLTFLWRPLDADRLADDVAAAAERARLSLAAAATASGVAQTFEVRHGESGLHVIETCVATDIVVLSSSRRREGDTMHGGRRLSETARDSAASVLWLPPVSVARRGPVVVVANADNPAVPVARQIAALVGEPLIVAAQQAGEGRVSLPGETLLDLIAALNNLNERLIVLSQAGPWGEMGAALAARRGVPVLVLE